MKAKPTEGATQPEQTTQVPPEKRLATDQNKNEDINTVSKETAKDDAKDMETNGDGDILGAGGRKMRRIVRHPNGRRADYTVASVNLRTIADQETCQ